METRTRFVPLTIETASDAARPMLQGSARNFGFIPSPVAKAAHSPGMLKHLLGGFAAFDQSSLSQIEREVVAFSVAFENECSYCMAMHSAMLARSPETPAGFVEAMRAGTQLSDPRLEALHQFVREIVRSRGRVSDASWSALEAAGYTETQALDALLGTSVYLLSTLANVLTRAELDPPFEAFRWVSSRNK